MHSSKKVFKRAQIYLTKCTVPPFDFVRYIGLDTKRDPNYYGSSVIIKWLIDRLGRDAFEKEILEEVDGTMPYLCEVEQKYIDLYDAVHNPDFANRNGRTDTSDHGDKVTLEMIARPDCKALREYISQIIYETRDAIKPVGQSKRELITRVMNTLAYSFSAYGDFQITYVSSKHYCNCNYTVVESVLSAMKSAGYIDYTSSEISLTDGSADFIAGLGLLPEDFTR